MALAIEGAISSGTVAGDSSLTFSHTTNGASTLLVVTISDGTDAAARSVTGATFNGDALTFHSQYAPTTNDRVEFWYRLSPDLSTTGDIVVTFSNSVDVSFAAGINFSGNDTSTPLGTMIGTEGAVDLWSIDVGSVSGDICVDCAIVVDDISADLWQPDAGQTEQWRFTNETSARSGFGSTEPAVGATTAMGWSRLLTADSVAVAGVAVKASSFNPATAIVGPNSERASGGMVGLNRLRQ